MPFRPTRGLYIALSLAAGIVLLGRLLVREEIAAPAGGDWHSRVDRTGVEPIPEGPAPADPTTQQPEPESPPHSPKSISEAVAPSITHGTGQKKTLPESIGSVASRLNLDLSGEEWIDTCDAVLDATNSADLDVLVQDLLGYNDPAQITLIHILNRAWDSGRLSEAQASVYSENLASITEWTTNQSLSLEALKTLVSRLPMEWRSTTGLILIERNMERFDLSPSDRDGLEFLRVLCTPSSTPPLRLPAGGLPEGIDRPH